MNGRGDYPEEMSDLPLDDAGAEALLHGELHAGDPELVAVAAFVREMRATALQAAPVPSPALAALFKSGAAVSAPAPRRPPLGVWRRRVAVSGIGLGVALTGVVGAGAAGLLPAPVEQIVGGIVEALTPLELPERAPDATGPTSDGLRPDGMVPGAPRSADDRSGAGEAVPGPAGTGSSSETPPRQANTTTPAGPGPTPTNPAPGASPGGTAPAITSPPVPPVGPAPSTPSSLPAPPPLPSPTVPSVSTSVPVPPPTVPGPPVTLPSFPW